MLQKLLVTAVSLAVACQQGASTRVCGRRCCGRIARREGQLGQDSLQDSALHCDAVKLSFIPWLVNCCCVQTKERATLLWMWGRGREGQLGQDSLQDSALPCLVPTLRARQVLQVGLSS